MHNINSTTKKKHEYYKKFPRTGVCQFCKIPNSLLIDASDNFVIIRNKFSYEIFDMCEVEDHLMVLPKNHVDNLSTLNEKEKIEFMNILIEYESKGYNVYFRGPKSIIKTVDHHHTHLLKPGKRIKSIKYNKEPYHMEYKTVDK